MRRQYEYQKPNADVVPLPSAAVPAAVRADEIALHLCPGCPVVYLDTIQNIARDDIAPRLLLCLQPYYLRHLRREYHSVRCQVEAFR